MQIQTVGLWEPPPNWVNHNLSKQQTFRDATTGFPAKLRARSIQPKFRPIRPGKEDHLKRWTIFLETFPVGPNRSIEFFGNFGWMDRALSLRNEHRNSTLMTPHYLDIGSAFDWLQQISHAARPIRSSTQIWVLTRHQYGISAFISQTSFRGETSGGVAKCRLFSPATWNNKITAQNILRRYK